jgi:hypothetical protein
MAGEGGYRTFRTPAGICMPGTVEITPLEAE